jgi:hypothetical protein
MLGVDFVINALFDTSGFRPAGDCAMALADTSNTHLITTKSTGFTGAIVMLNGQAAKHITVRSFINAPTVAAALWAARFAL